MPSPREQLLLQEGAAREPGLGEHLVVERSAVEERPGWKVALLRAEADRRSERVGVVSLRSTWATCSLRPGPDRFDAPVSPSPRLGLALIATLTAGRPNQNDQKTTAANDLFYAEREVRCAM